MEGNLVSPIRIVVADDHRLLRLAVRAIVEAAAGIEIVAEAADGREALDAVRVHQPNVLLTDITMPSLNGLELVSRVSKEFPHVRLIVLSIHSAEEYVCQALRCGAAGYLLKDAEPEEICFAIRSVAAGETYLTPKVSKHVITDYLNRLDRPASPLELLSPRQRECLQLIAEGRSTKEIARLMGVSVKTAETFRSQLMDRLDIHDIAGLVRLAVRVGLVSRES